MDIDRAKQRFEVLRAEWCRREKAIETEADVRFQIIDQMLTEVLGWSRNYIRAEPHSAAGYVDYLLDGPTEAKFVIEAKRSGENLVGTALQRQRWYKLNGPALASGADGIKQAMRYCLETAAMSAAVTNGCQWIGFWALRTDGKPPSEGRAAVFPCFEAISDAFSLFYDLFSPEGIANRLYQVHVHEAEGLHVRHSEHLAAAIPSESIGLMRQSSLALDLKPVFHRFFSSISGDDQEMLAQCFVESRESREADDSLKKITRDLIGRVDLAQAGQLQAEIEQAIEIQRGEFVLIVGNKGAGKSTFVDRFFRLVMDPRLRSRCLVLNLDVADSPGSLEKVDDWLTQRLLRELERVLFENAKPTYEQLQGAFMEEYDRWRSGEHKYLYKRDKGAFKERFGEWLYQTRANNPQIYAEALLISAVKQRQLMPCLVFDNTDHFPQPFQEAVFQYAQALFRTVFSFVVCPVTDRTIWQLSKHGPLQSYKTRVFYLPVPSAKEVIAKRVYFLQGKLNKSGEPGRYFLEQGIRIAIKDIEAFAACVEEVFINEEYVGRIVGWLSNHDIRRSLTVAERIITSPLLRMTDLVKAYLAGDRLFPRRREIKLALLRGNYSHFKSDQSDFIVNLFEVQPNSVTSPLLRLSILSVLLDADAGKPDPREAYLSVGDMVNYFEPMGVPPKIVREHLQVLLSHRLVQPYDLTDNEVHEGLLLRVAPAGRIHQEFAFAKQEGSYICEMALTTPVRDQSLVDSIRQKLDARHSLTFTDWQEISCSFVRYCLEEDQVYVSVPNTDTYKGQQALRLRLESIWRYET